MITIDGLKKLEVNTDEGLSRCMGSEQFYIKLVNMIPDVVTKVKEFVGDRKKKKEGEIAEADDFSEITVDDIDI